jgi:hypothetical protein
VLGWLAFGAVPCLSGVAEIAGGLVLGVICFGSLGLVLSSVARSAESASPIANASYLPLAIMSGIFGPTFSMPKWLSAIMGLFPVRALAQILQQGYTPVAHAPLEDLLVLLAWAAAGTGFAVWRFRWQLFPLASEPPWRAVFPRRSKARSSPSRSSVQTARRPFGSRGGRGGPLARGVMARRGGRCRRGI